MINRPEYQKKLLQLKVIMGVRYCGKSTLFELFRYDLYKKTKKAQSNHIDKFQKYGF